jgi:hypothetical protein
MTGPASNAKRGFRLPALDAVAPHRPYFCAGQHSRVRLDKAGVKMSVKVEAA